MNPETMNTETTVFTAPDIVCGGCANAIKRAVGNLAGVSKVEVDVPTKKVSVEHDEKISRDQIALALEKSGFATS